MPELMKAGIASPDGVQIAEIPLPQPGAEEVLVKVAAAGVNRADLSAAKAAGTVSHGTLGKAIGMEWAGEIVEVGSAVTDLGPGELVMCSGSGGYAEYAVADMGRTTPVGDADLSTEQVAVLPLVLMTAHDALVKNGRLEKGDAVLVHGASTAVGLASMQIARHHGAGMIVGTSTSPERGERLKAFGANEFVDPTDKGWVDHLLELTGDNGVNLVVDMISGPALNDVMKATAVLGRIVNIGRLGGRSADFNFDLHALKRLSYIGVTFRTRSVAEIRAIVQAMRDDLWDAVVAGRIVLPIDRSFELEKAAEAHAFMSSNAHFGKIVLRV